MAGGGEEEEEGAVLVKISKTFLNSNVYAHID